MLQSVLNQRIQCTKCSGVSTKVLIETVLPVTPPNAVTGTGTRGKIQELAHVVARCVESETVLDGNNGTELYQCASCVGPEVRYYHCEPATITVARACASVLVQAAVQKFLVFVVTILRVFRCFVGLCKTTQECVATWEVKNNSSQTCSSGNGVC